MARRSKNDGTKELAWMLTIMTVGIFLIIKWTVEFIVWFFKLVVRLIDKASKKAEKNKNKNSIIQEPFKNTIVKEEILKEPSVNIKKQLNIFDKSIYDELFPIQIRSRGESYYEDDKIKYFKNNTYNYSCVVKGTEDYKVTIKFKNDSDDIEEMNCTCPYFSDKNNNCKHIYALLYKIKCEGNKDKIINEILSRLDSIYTMIDNSQIYIDNNNSKFYD